MKKIRYLISVVLFALLALFFSFKEDLFLVSKNLDIFAALYKEININYVEDTNPVALMQSGIDSMLEDLDPYTEYVPESEIEDYKLKYVSTQYGGIGASTIVIDQQLYINEILEDNPAFKADLRAGDLIVKINNITTFAKDRAEISKLLRGPKGSSLDLEIKREGKLIQKTLTRAEIKQANVTYSAMLDGETGYIRLDKFLENAGDEVKDALTVLLKENPKSLILDLRNNGGGILQEAVKIVNLFVEQNVHVVTQKGRNPEKSLSYKTIVKPVALDLPLVVLINANSASAAEIVAGALQDLDRAIIIGQRSYGKGLVQQAFNLPYNSLVKITVAKYYTPSGRCIQALDYTHKDGRGKAVHFADSLVKAFRTKAGRTVYDGNGIYPDIALSAAQLSPIAISLVQNNLFFDYANAYRRNHQQIADAKHFKLTTQEYNDFVASLSGKDYAYNTQAEKLLTAFMYETEKDKSTNIKMDLEVIKAKITAAKKTDFNRHQDEIKQLLETQIISRFYYEKGKIQQAFQYDKEIASAKSLFKQEQEMINILQGNGVYQTIGKPQQNATSLN